jgi:hypothetical protein
MDIKRSGSQPSTKGSTEYFTGSVRIDYGEQLLSVNSITKDHESRAQGMVIIRYFIINNTSYNLNANSSFLFFLSLLYANIVNHIISCDLDNHLYSM